VGKAPAEQEGIFDAAPFTIPVPTLDGHRADVLKLTFGGGVEIDKMLSDDLERFKALSFGDELTLNIEVVVSKVNWTLARKADGGEKVTHVVGFKVTEVTL
jgi:hypothetical protein